jgi:hypothetical protein
VTGADVQMHFFLYEIVARIVAIYLCFDCSRRLWRGLLERKIAYQNGNGDWLGLLLDWVDWSKVIAYRDSTPIRYWIQISVVTFTLIASVGVAIFGWWEPNT